MTTGTATAVQRLGVLLRAGVAPVTAWRAVAAADASSAVAVEVATVESAHEIPAALLRASEDDRSWRPVAAAWRVASESGAPLGPTLERLADVLRRTDRIDSEVRASLAGPLATARILVLLPVAAVLLGMLFGFDTARVLLATPLGWICVVLGLALLGGAAAWMRRMTRGARAHEIAPGLAADLVAIALQGGLGPDAAVRLADDALRATSLGAADDVEGALRFAQSAGVPASALLRAEADDARHGAAADAEARAAALGVRLMLPLGLGILPAFIVLGVVPIVLSLVGSLRL